ncbi:MAG: CDP-diglyceride synthetase [Candidatus Westeberhardia cardiocondylae]|nr:CDP-diglyceride synthetase [Candidatus Westeberhardia cardiocondylae]
MIKHRIISSIFLIPFIILIILELSLKKLTFFLLLLNLLCIWEWNKLCATSIIQKLTLFIIFNVLPLILIILTTFYLPHHIFISHIKYIFIIISLTWWLIALLLILFYPISTKIWKKSSFFKLLFGNLTIIPFIWSIIILKKENQIFYYNYSIGTWKILYVIILVWELDSSFYIFGKLLGNYKLSENISPKKTWEGLIIGTILTIITQWVFKKYIIPFHITTIKFNIYCIIIMISAILGDLTESMFKREAKIKDTGTLIPGHGGILDRIDSLSSTLPIFTCLTLLINL